MPDLVKKWREQHPYLSALEDEINAGYNSQKYQQEKQNEQYEQQRKEYEQWVEANQYGPYGDERDRATPRGVSNALTPEMEARRQAAAGVNRAPNAYQTAMMQAMNAAPAVPETRSNTELRRDANRQIMLAAGTTRMAADIGNQLMQDQSLIFNPTYTSNLRTMGQTMEAQQNKAAQAQAQYQTVKEQRKAEEAWSKYSPFLENPDFLEKSKPDLSNENRVYYSMAHSQEAIEENGANVNAAAYATDDEKRLYYYLWNTKGSGAANAYYYNYVEHAASARKAVDVELRTAARVQNNGFLGDVRDSFKSIGTNAISGIGLVDIAFQNIGAEVSNLLGLGDPGINYYSLAQMPGIVTDSIRSNVAKKIAESTPGLTIGKAENAVNVASFLYETGMSMADSTAMILMNLAGVPEWLTLGSMGASAGTRAVRDAKERGASDWQALAFGISSAIMEALFEKVSLDHILKPSDGKFFKNAAKQTFVEGSEEFFTTWGNTVMDQVIMGDKSELFTRERQLMEQGYSQKDALNKAALEWCIQIGTDAFAGMISGIGMGGAKEVGTGLGVFAQGVRQDMQTARALTDYQNAQQAAPQVMPQQTPAAPVQQRQLTAREQNPLQFAMNKAQNGETVTGNDAKAILTDPQAVQTLRDAGVLADTIRPGAEGRAQIQQAVQTLAEQTRAGMPETLQETERTSQLPVQNQQETAQERTTPPLPRQMAQEQQERVTTPPVPQKTQEAAQEPTLRLRAQEEQAPRQEPLRLPKNEVAEPTRQAPLTIRGANATVEENRQEENYGQGQQTETAAAAGEDDFRARAETAAEGARRSYLDRIERSSGLGRVLQDLRNYRIVRGAESRASEVSRIRNQAEAGNQRDISAQDYGIANGSAEQSAKELDSATASKVLGRNWDRAVAELAREGVTLKAMTGQLKKEDGSQVRAFFSGDGKTIVVQIDHPKLSWNQLLDHEDLHRRIKANKNYRKAVEDALLADKNLRAYLPEIIDRYSRAYAEHAPDLTSDDVIEELLADYRAGFDMLDPLGMNPTTARAAKRAAKDIKGVEKERYKTNGGRPAPAGITETFAEGKNSVEPPYRLGTAALTQFEESLSPEARKTYDLFNKLNNISRSGTAEIWVGSGKARHLKWDTIADKSFFAKDWNNYVKTNKEFAAIARELVAALPDSVKKFGNFNDDGTVTPTEFEEKFKMNRSFIQRVVDALPKNVVQPVMNIDGHEYRISDKPISGAVGGEEYRQAIIAEKRRLYKEGKLPTVSTGALSHDNWGAMGFLATNTKTGASGDFTTFCPQMYFNNGCFYCYRRAALTSGSNNKLTGETVWYSGEILQLRPEDVVSLNKKGGLRIQSFGDWQDMYTPMLADMLYDAQMKGLQIKIITKEPSMIETVARLRKQALGLSLYFNLSADYTIERRGESDNREVRKAAPLNAERPFLEHEWLTGEPGEDIGWKRALSVQEANEYRKKYSWVNTRIVATTLKEYLRGLIDPTVDVVTGYHGKIKYQERVSSETGETLIEMEALGDSGMPQFKRNEQTGEWEIARDKDGKPLNGKNHYQKELCNAIVERGLQEAYYAKACCITGRCAECQGLCGGTSNQMSTKNATNRDADNLRWVYLQMEAHPGAGMEGNQLFAENVDLPEGTTQAEDLVDIYDREHGIEPLREKPVEQALEEREKWLKKKDREAAKKAAKAEGKASTEMDDDYMFAVNWNDTQTAREMVQDAAKAWGAAADENGKLIELYHGTKVPGFTKFNPTGSRSGLIYTTTSKKVADSYGGSNYRLYGNLGSNPLEIDGDKRGFDLLQAPELFGDDEEHHIDEIARKAKEEGYTALVVRNVFDGPVMADDYIFFNSDQLKSADPVTYDDNGNVIPLSERFNQENKDIRYSIEISEEDLDEAVYEEMSASMRGIMRRLQDDVDRAKEPEQKPEPKKKAQRASDEEYMAALEDGDIAKAQRLVRETADAAMPKSKVRSASTGELRYVYHYTNKNFYEFRPMDQSAGSNRTLGDGYYVSTSETEFKNFGKNKMTLFANITKPFEMSLTKKQAQTIYDKYFRPLHPNDIGKTYEDHVLSKLQTESRVFDYLKEAAEKNGTTTSKILTDLGFDGVHDGVEWVAFKPEQLKSADVGTYNDDGQMIPLSERFNTKNEDIRYSLEIVDPVQPVSEKWQRGATYDEVKAAHPTLFELAADEAETRNPTQINGTVKTYRKIYDMLKQEGFDGTILDASSGLGYGTRAGRDEYGYDVDDIEPFPDKSYSPKYTDYSKLKKTYDVVISNAVLNVIPQDLRDAMVVKIGEMLNPGGRAFINVRGTDVKNAKSKIAINEDQMEYFIADSGSYQKGFRQAELVDYLKDALGDGFTVTPNSSFGGVSAVVTKNGGSASIEIDPEVAAQFSPEAIALRQSNRAKGVKGERKVSRVRSNTYEYSGLYNEVEAQMDEADEENYTYDPVSEKKSMNEALGRLKADFDGEVSRLSEADRQWGGSDLDTAMGILHRYCTEGRATGDYGDFWRWSKVIQEKGTKGGQFIQAFAKYTRTGTGAAMKGAKDIHDRFKLNPAQQKQVDAAKKKLMDGIDGDMNGAAQDAMKQAKGQKEPGKKQDGKVDKKKLDAEIQRRKDAERLVREISKLFEKQQNHGEPVENWLNLTGEELARKIAGRFSEPKQRAKTTMQTILSDLVGFAEEHALPDRKKAEGTKRTAIDTITDYLNNRDAYGTAWAAAQSYLRAAYTDDQEKLDALNSFLTATIAYNAEGTDRTMLDAILQSADVLGISEKRILELTSAGATASTIDRIGDELVSQVKERMGADYDESFTQQLKDAARRHITGIALQESSEEQRLRLGGMTTDAARQLEINLQKLLTQSRGDKNRAAQSVADYLIRELGIPSSDAAIAAERITGAFMDELANRADRKLQQMFAEKKPKTQEQRDRLLDLIRLGGLTNSNVEDAVVDALGLGGMSRERQRELVGIMAQFGETLDAMEADDLDGLKDLIRAQAAVRNTPLSRQAEKTLAGETDAEYLREFALAQLDAIAGDFAEMSPGAKISTFQTISHLLNMRTALRNLTSNQVFDLVDSAANNLATIPDMVIGAFTGKRTVGTNKSWLSEMKRAGAKQGAARNALEVRLDVSPDDRQKSKYGTAGRRTNSMAASNAFGRILSHLEEVMGYELNTTDEFHKGSVRGETLESLARFVERGDITQEQANAWAEEEALYRSFQDDTLVGNIMGELKTLLNVIGFGDSGKTNSRGRTIHDFGLGDLVVKYTQVPGALIHRGIEYSPLGYAKMLYDLAVAKDSLVRTQKRGEDVANAQRKLALDIGRATTGSGLITLFAVLAKAGLLRRDDDDKDKNAKAMHAAQGLIGTQLNLTALKRWIEGGDLSLTDGDVLADIGFLEPLDSLMTIATLMANDDDLKLADIGVKSLDGVWKAISNTSAMQTISNIISTVQYHDEENDLPLYFQIPIEIASDSISGFVPSPVRQLAQATDTTYRDQYRSKALNDQIRAKVMNSIPGVRQMLAPKITPLGEDKKYQKPLLNYLNATLNPGNINVYQGSGVVDELNRVYGETDDAKIWPERNAPYSFTANDEKWTLTPDERTQYQRTRGQQTNAIMEAVMGTDWYKAMGATDQADVLNWIGNFSNYIAKKEMLAGRGVDAASKTYDKYYEALMSGTSPEDVVASAKSKVVAAAEETAAAETIIAEAKIPEASKEEAETMSADAKRLYAAFLQGGVSDSTARNLATSMEGSEASGHEQWRMVYDAAGKEGEKAVTSVMTDDMKRNWNLAKDVGVSMDDYIKVREGFKDLNGNGNKSQDEWNATLDSFTFSTNSAKDKSIKGTLWQILTGSGSTKNNPYDKEAGQKVIDAKNGGGSGSGSYAPVRIPTLRIPEVPKVTKPSSGLRLPATNAAPRQSSGLRLK